MSDLAHAPNLHSPGCGEVGSFGVNDLPKTSREKRLLKIHNGNFEFLSFLVVFLLCIRVSDVLASCIWNMCLICQQWLCSIVIMICMLERKCMKPEIFHYLKEFIYNT